MRIEPRECIKHRNPAICLLAHADDLVLMEESQDRIKSLFERLNDVAQNIRLFINEYKTEYIIVGRRGWTDCILHRHD